LQFYHLHDQRYRVCVRQEHGYCGIRWSVCGDDDDKVFSISGDGTDGGRTGERGGWHD
jgi:hypothetical protein